MDSTRATSSANSSLSSGNGVGGDVAPPNVVTPEFNSSHPVPWLSLRTNDAFEGSCMSYAVAHLDEIDELNDGREPWRPVRHHFGIRAFGVNAWTARDVGDRIINEHDESEPDSDEELYLVLQGRAVFELDGDRVAAPTGTFVFAPPGVKRTAFAEEPETTVIALG